MNGPRLRCIFAALLLLLTLVACSPTLNTTEPPPSAAEEAPFYAWDFSLDALNGDSYTLSDLRGQWVLINFWATWCAPCVDEMPALQTIHDTNDNLTVLGINQREDAETVRAFAEAHSIAFPLLLNPGDQTLVDYQVIGLPQTIIVDPNGEIVWRQFGPIALDEFQPQLTALMHGEL